MGNTPKIRVALEWGRCSQQKTCNIFETGQDIGPKLLLMTNRKSHTRFRLVQLAVSCFIVLRTLQSSYYRVKLT